MFGSKLKKTGIVGIISALLFAGAFAAYNGRRTTEGDAIFVLGCETGTEIRLFLSDSPEYGTRDSRILFDNAAQSGQEKTFYLPDEVISAGKYEVRTISSDNHYNHRSSAPGEDVQFQPDEEYYITIGDQRTSAHTTDFTDFYDWRGADDELLQDDDNNVDTVPSVVRNTWQGESLGVIDLAEDTRKIKTSHTDVFDEVVPRANSVIPSALILNCIDERSPALEIEKLVDANNDDVFDDEQEQSKDGQNVRWKVVGRNVGDAADNAATIESCAPQGTTLVAGSARVVAGSQGGNLVESGACVVWTGPLTVNGSVTIEYDVLASDIDGCDATDGAVDGVCSCPAKIFSDATGTTAANPADSDDAAINQLKPSVSIIKKVDGSDDNTSFSDDSEQIAPDGSNVAWEITATNAGPGDMENARVVDTYPAGVTLGEASASIGTVTVEGSQIVWNGSLSANQDVVITVDSTINDVAAFNACESADAPGNVDGDGVCTNRAFVGEADGTSPVGFAGETTFDDAEVYAVLSPSLTIKKYSDGIDANTVFSDEDAELIESTQAFTWRVVGCNVGDAIEPNARIVDVVPAGVNLNDAATAVRVDGSTSSPAIAVTVDPASGRPAIVWNGPLSVGGCVTIEYTSTVADQAGFDTCVGVSTGVAGECGVVAYIGQATADNALSVDLLTRASDPAYVIAMFESILAIEKLVDGDGDSSFDTVVEQVGLNETFPWKLVATNTGNAAEPNARVVDTLPTNMALVSTSVSQVTVDLQGGAVTDIVDIEQQSGVNTVIWDGQLPVGAQVEIVFMVQLVSEDMLNDCVAETQGENCRNTAQVGRRDVLSKTNVVGQTDSDSADVFATPTGRLTVIKEVDVDGDGTWSDLETITFDTWFDWRISVSNQGDGTITDAAMLDVFPEGVIVDPVVQQTGSGTNQVDAGATNYRLFWTTPSFAPSETAEFIVRAKIVDLAAFTLCDEGTVDGDSDSLCRNRAYVGTGTDAAGFTDIDTDDAQIDVLRVPQLYIDKVVDGTDSDSNTSDFEETTVDGEQSEWVITFGNSGTGIASDVTVYDALPQGVSYVSHDVEGAGTASYDAAVRRVTWNGSINPGGEVVLTIQTSFENGDAFVSCDLADGSSDTMCRNTVRLSHEDTELEDPALVLSGSVSPELSIIKTVDANNDQVFSEVEEINSAGDVATWRVEVENTGTVSVNDIAVSDTVQQGLEYLPDSISEVEGDEHGVALFNDGSIQWSGDLAAGSKVVIQFQTRVASVTAFTACNFSDGNADDSQCTNNAVLSFVSGDTPIAEDNAHLTTSLEVILAYTGSRNISTVAVGGTIALIAAVLTVGAYATRSSRGDSGGDDGPQNPLTNMHPPQIIMPQ